MGINKEIYTSKLNLDFSDDVSKTLSEIVGGFDQGWILEMKCPTNEMPISRIRVLSLDPVAYLEKHRQNRFEVFN